MNLLDRLTCFIDRALDLVLVRYPARTGLGVALGCTLSFLAHLLEPSLKRFSFADFATLPWWAWLAPGILIMHFPTMALLFKQKSIGNDQIDLALELIARGNFSPAERRQHYRRLIHRVVDNTVLAQKSRHDTSMEQRAVLPTRTPSPNS
jgi:hypothetical protein